MNKGTVSQCSDCFSVNGIDLYVYSGEIHYFRVPKELWKDRLLKAKRCFLNTIGTYAAWNWHEQKEGKLNFSKDRDIDHFLDLCKQLELYTIIRPGPYICAEWDSGGFPSWLWVKDIAFRSLCPKFIEYTARWYDTICAISRRHLITNGGTAILFQIENEFFGGNVPYLLKLAEMAEERGIDVPIVHNKGRPLRGTNVLDSLDFYPQVWEIDEVERSIDLLREEQPDKPHMVMELEGGWFSLFGGSLPTSRGSFPAEWTNVLTKTCIAKGINAINFYMFHGGTNFGYWTAKDITTTYDYEAAIREWGELSNRYWVMRLIGGFLQAFNEALAHSKPVEGLVTASNRNVDAFCRRGEKSSFLFVRNMTNKEESVRLKSSLTQFGEIPVERSIKMRPKSMLMLPVNYELKRTEATLLYSTSQVFSIDQMIDRTVIVVYGPVDTPGEVCFKLEEEPKVLGDIEYEWNTKERILRFNFIHSELERTVLIQLRRNLELVVTNDERAARTWLPQFHGEDIPMMSNIYFLRDWSAEHKQLSLFVEINPKELVKVNAVFPRRVKKVSINRRSVAFNYDNYTSVLAFSFSTREPPNLVQMLNGTWRMKAESPEKNIDFDDSKWKRWTPCSPLESLGYLKNGYFWYRCRFQAPKDMRNTTLAIPDVKDYAAIFLNGKFLGKGKSKVLIDAGKALKNGENVLAICVESTGHRHHPCLTKNPNGILSQVYLSEEERVKLKDWKFKSFTLETKAGLPAAIDIPGSLISDQTPREASSDTNDEEWENFTIPPADKVNQSISCEPEEFKVLWLRTWVDLPKRLEGKSLVLSLKELLPGTYKLYVNGAVKAFSSWTKSVDGAAEAVDIDITDQVKLGEANLLAVALYTTRGLVLHVPESFPELIVYGHRINGEWRVIEGLHGEREKWFKTELDDSGWEEVKIPCSLKTLGLANKGIVWYRKRFCLENDCRYVAPLRLTLNEVRSRCLIFLNGRLIGRYADIGPQKDFYLPEPWLRDENTLALAVESFDEDGGITGEVVVSPYYMREKTQIKIDVE